MANTSLQEQTQLVKSLIDKREYQQALDHLDALLEKHPTNKSIKDVRQQVQAKINAAKAAPPDEDMAGIEELPASSTKASSVKTTQELSATASKMVLEDMPEPEKPSPAKSVADVASSIAHNKTVTTALETSKKVGEIALTEGRAIAEKGARKLKEFMDEPPAASGEAEDATASGIFRFLAASFDNFGFYQIGWADTLDGHGKRAAEFNQAFWNKLLQDHELQPRIKHNQMTVKSARRAENLDTANDGIVTALIRIARYGSDLYVSYRLFMQLPWSRWRVIIVALWTVVGLCSVVGVPPLVAFWVVLSVFCWWRFGAPLRWLRGQVSEFDHDDLMAMQITIGKCIGETVETLGIKAKLRDQPAPGGYREVKHI